jgi:hypothetical protein
VALHLWDSTVNDEMCNVEKSFMSHTSADGASQTSDETCILSVSATDQSPVSRSVAHVSANDDEPSNQEDDCVFPQKSAANEGNNGKTIMKMKISKLIKKASTKEEDNALRMISHAIRNHVHSSKTVAVSDEDECDAFGRHVAYTN